MNSSKSVSLNNESNVFKSQTIQQLETSLSLKTTQLFECQKCGNYVKADELKATINRIKKEFSEKKLQSMILNHKTEKCRLQKSNQDEISKANEAWTKKIEDFNCQKDVLKKQMQEKHLDEIAKAKLSLEDEISHKMKESSQCLNYRKIQEQMKRQKKYSQAHQIQQIISEMQKKQKIAFSKQRQSKIQTALNAIMNRQKTEMLAFYKKIETGLKELTKQRQKQVEKLRLKHTNAIKEILSQQEKQILGEKGQIKSRVSLSMCKSRSKFVSVSKK